MLMAREYEGKVAIVTGGAGGIGSQCVRMLASRGASVAIMDMFEARTQADEIAAEFQVKVLAIRIDVTNTEIVKDCFSKVLSWAGRLDFAVNAAGIFPPTGTVDNADPASWAKIIAVNLNGVFHCLQQEIRIMRSMGIKGSIVNFSSDAGTVATVGCAAYVASKHAVNGLTKTAALECARSGVRINAVAPGNIETPMIKNFGDYNDIAKATQPTGRCGKPEEVAELVCFLLSDRAAFMTGSIVAIDGGITTTGYSGGLETGIYSS
jgi:NAD(P)-dependent dehydrogenase (short-subunit alcohol dehydrogenase family)